MRKLVWLIVVYAAVLFLAAPRLPLWLDEVLTLVGSAQPSLPALLDYIRTVSGGSPLTFLGPRLAMQWFGANEIAARLPSILASLASAPALMLLARRAGASPILAVALFLSLPLQFRYALEARPYALALCLTAWLTVLFLERRLPWLYVLLAVAAAFTQPYAAFVVAGHFVWAVWEDRRRAWLPLIALSVSAAALLPWYLYYERYWRAVNQAQQIVTWDWRAPMVFVHEIGGSGYLGSGLLLAGAAIGWRQARDRFWLCCLVVPLAAALAANVVFHYFFSVRQVIYVLPVLALLCWMAITRWPAWRCASS